MTHAIGGYFELSAGPANRSFLDDGIKLNSGRNAFEYILQTKGFKKVHIPYYTCEVLTEPLKKLELDFEYYHVNEKLEPLLDPSLIGAGEAFLYTNYFGLKDNYIHNLKTWGKQIIIDNAQGLFSRPVDGFDTFYSPRKFFGLPDGGIAFTADHSYYDKLDRDESTGRFAHLLKRLDISAEAGYCDFQLNDNGLSEAALMQMSNSSRNLFAAQDLKMAMQIRNENFNYLHKALSHMNDVQFIEAYNGPLIYPYMPLETAGLREKLLEYRIFCPNYWPNVKSDSAANPFESKMASECIFLPIDQRYGKSEMDKILELIL